MNKIMFHKKNMKFQIFFLSVPPFFFWRRNYSVFIFVLHPFLAFHNPYYIAFSPHPVFVLHPFLVIYHSIKLAYYLCLFTILLTYYTDTILYIHLLDYSLIFTYNNTYNNTYTILILYLLI